MAKIDFIIPQSRFEQVGDLLGTFVAEEIRNQYQLTNNPDINATVYRERFIPYDMTETPLVSITFAGGSFSNKDISQSDGTYTYNFDVYTDAESTDDTSGDVIATLKLHRILAIIRAILEAPQYKTLGQTPPFNASVMVKSITIADPVLNNDTRHEIRGRLEYEIVIPEGVTLSTANIVSDSLTQMRLYNTNKGYRYMWSIKADIPIGTAGASFTLPAQYAALPVLSVNDGAQSYNTGFTQTADLITMTNGVTFAPGQLVSVILQLNDYSAAITIPAAGNSFTIPAAFAGKKLVLFTGTQPYASGFTSTGTTVTMTNGVTFASGDVVVILAGAAIAEITATAGNTFTIPNAYANFEAVLLFDGSQGYNRSCFSQIYLVGTMTTGTTFINGQSLIALLR